MYKYERGIIKGALKDNKFIYNDKKLENTYT